MKRIVLMALVATSLFSCSKQDEMSNDNGDKLNVSLKVSQKSITRTVGGGNVTTGSKTAIESGTLFFFNSTGNVVYKYTLTPADVTSVADYRGKSKVSSLSNGI